MHNLVAVAPVVKQAWAESFRDLNDIDQPSQNSQRVHDDKEAQWVRAAHSAAVHPEKEEAEAEQGLPDKSPEAQNVSAGCSSAVNAIGWQDDVGQQGSLLHSWIAKKGNVDDG